MSFCQHEAISKHFILQNYKYVGLVKKNPSLTFMSTLMPTFRSTSFSVIWLGFPMVRLFEMVPLSVWLGYSHDSMRRKEI